MGLILLDLAKYVRRDNRILVSFVVKPNTMSRRHKGRQEEIFPLVTCVKEADMSTENQIGPASPPFLPTLALV